VRPIVEDEFGIDGATLHNSHGRILKDEIERYHLATLDDARNIRKLVQAESLGLRCKRDRECFGEFWREHDKRDIKK